MFHFTLKERHCTPCQRSGCTVLHRWAGREGALRSSEAPVHWYMAALREACAVPQLHDTTFSGLLGNSFAISIKHESEGREAHPLAAHLAAALTCHSVTLSCNTNDGL